MRFKLRSIHYIAWYFWFCKFRNEPPLISAKAICLSQITNSSVCVYGNSSQCCIIFSITISQTSFLIGGLVETKILGVARTRGTDLQKMFFIHRRTHRLIPYRNDCHKGGSLELIKWIVLQGSGSVPFA